MTKFKQWIAERIPFDLDGLKAYGSEPVPDHLRHWWWALGGTPAYLFLLQIFTGILLTFYYVPDVDNAYQSVLDITNKVSYGWYIRSIHKWSANFMIITVILHMMRVFFTGAYRRPREINWMLGSLLWALTLFTGFTGYSLIYEQLSYWGLTVVGNLFEGIPFVGVYIADMFRGGEAIGQKTLSRVFILHVAILPALIMILIGFHFALMHALGITPYAFNKADKKKTYPFVPDHLVNEIIIALILMLLITVLAIVFPAGIEGPANPLVTPAHIKPEWYFYFAFRILKLTSITFAVLIMGFGFFIIMTWPFIDALIRKKRPGSEISMAVGFIVVLFLVALTLWEVIVLHYGH